MSLHHLLGAVALLAALVAGHGAQADDGGGGPMAAFESSPGASVGASVDVGDDADATGFAPLGMIGATSGPGPAAAALSTALPLLGAGLAGLGLIAGRRRVV